MAVAVDMPKLGVEMETARLDEWLVAEGDSVAAGAPIASVETQKVVGEVESPAAGRIHLVAEVGHDYAVGDRLALLAETDAEYAELAAAGGAAARDGRPLASPLARRVADAHGIGLEGVDGSGPRGAIRRRDVEAAIAARAASPAQGNASQPAAAGAAPPAAVSTPPPATAPYDELPLSPMRRTIADRMLLGMQGSAQMTDVREQDVGALVALRREAVAKADRPGFRLGFTALFAKAATIALTAVPELNASIEGDSLRRYRSVDLGVAVAIEDGLLVPVLRGAQDLGLRQLQQRLDELIARARERRLGGDEMAGATFTITNFGTYGSHFGTPILTPGQAAMLGVGALIERPVVRDGRIVVGTVMHTSVTIDHRVVDGEVAGRFQNALGDLFADPERLLYG